MDVTSDRRARVALGRITESLVRVPLAQLLPVAMPRRTLRALHADRSVPRARRRREIPRASARPRVGGPGYPLQFTSVPFLVFRCDRVLQRVRTSANHGAVPRTRPRQADAVRAIDPSPRHRGRASRDLDRDEPRRFDRRKDAILATESTCPEPVAAELVPTRSARSRLTLRRGRAFPSVCGAAVSGTAVAWEDALLRPLHREKDSVHENGGPAGEERQTRRGC